MTRSMTGFVARAVPITIDRTSAQLHITIKSLNARFFEATCRLPYQFSILETMLIKQLASKLRRGHVYVTIHTDNQDLFKGSVSPNLTSIEHYVQALEQIKQRYPIQGTLTIDSLLQLPNVFHTSELALDEQSKRLIMNACDDLIHELIQAQEAEGILLAQDIEQRVTIMAATITSIEQASAQLIAMHKEKIMHMTHTATPEQPQQPADVNRQTAAYLLLDKMDIHEETVRFRTHLASIMDQVYARDIEKGKRLDFTLQELMREINTITAKCSDATIGKLGIDIKVELEKTREQAQNIV